MPAIVDHDQRRRELAEVAARLVAEGGADAATVRGVAGAAGYSTKVVSHYFADKRALLLLTNRHAADRSGMIAEASQCDGPDAGAYACALLPLDEARRQNWLVWFAFWGLAITDPEFAAEQRAGVRGARARLTELMAADPRFRGLSSKGRADQARTLLTQVMGVAVQAMFEPEDWNAGRQIEAIREHLAALGAENA